MIINIEGIIFQINFGLKQLIFLKKNSNINAIKNLSYFLSQLMQDNLNPSILERLTDEEKSKLIEDIYSSINLPSFDKIEELYIKAVGEMGLPPKDVEQMTPEQIELAYEGYLRKLETQANLITIAIQKARSNNNNNLIRLTEEKGYSIGETQEREKTFSLLNI